MKPAIKAENLRAFRATCSEAEIKETNKCLYKFVSMFGPKTLIYWKKSGVISQREKHNNTNL